MTLPGPCPASGWKVGRHTIEIAHLDTTSSGLERVQLGHPANEQVAGLGKASKRRSFHRGMVHAERDRDLAHQGDIDGSLPIEEFLAAHVDAQDQLSAEHRLD